MTPYIAILIIVLLIAAVYISFQNLYNKLVMLNYNVDKAFANIDVLLKQRADEIPNLIAVVKENKNYEQSVLEKLTDLRTRFLNSKSSDEKVEISNQIEKSLKSIFAVSENYPDLKANKSFLELQKRVSEIEDMIADRREFFNESVNMYNIGIHEFPNFILAAILRYKDKSLLQISEKEKKYEGVKF